MKILVLALMVIGLTALTACDDDSGVVCPCWENPEPPETCPSDTLYYYYVPRGKDKGCYQVVCKSTKDGDGPFGRECVTVCDTTKVSLGNPCAW